MITGQNLSYEAAKYAFSGQNLFDNKTWRYSPQAFPLTSAQLGKIEQIGPACYEFYRAQETLYLRSVESKNLLRNRPLKTPWVADYLDRGKPEALVQYARNPARRGEQPIVIRPDLLMTDKGFAMTEIDSVPGGIGLTAFLNYSYSGLHGEALVGGGKRNMIDAFYDALAGLIPSVDSPYIAIVVSDEASTYRPEMEWLASQLRNSGRNVYVFHPRELRVSGSYVCADIDETPRKMDLIYRFWELFDLANIPIADDLVKADRATACCLTPPMRPFQEEKLSFALFHHHILKDYWRETLSKQAYKVLAEIIPQTWVMDPTEIPPNALLDGPLIGGRPMTDWTQLIEAGKKERKLIIKISGFHETAWGARSVTLGSDCSRSDWRDAIQQAVSMADRSLHILQTYEKPKRMPHPVYGEDGSLFLMQSRIRLCPYYFVDPSTRTTRLHGILATLCPSDKKIIHGMKDAALVPCVCSNSESAQPAA